MAHRSDEHAEHQTDEYNRFGVRITLAQFHLPQSCADSANAPSIRLNSLSSSGLSTAPTRRSNLSRRSERSSNKPRPFSVRYIRTTRLSPRSRFFRSNPSLSSLLAKRVTREGSISNLWLNSPWLIPSSRASSARVNQVPALTPVSRSKAPFTFQKAKPRGANNGPVSCAVSTDRFGVSTTLSSSTTSSSLDSAVWLT